MSGCCSSMMDFNFNTPCPNDLYKDIIKMTKELGVIMTKQEKEDLKCSRLKEADFMPMKHSKTFFNVRVQMDYYSLIANSKHKGFGRKSEEELLKNKTRQMLIDKGLNPEW